MVVWCQHSNPCKSLLVGLKSYNMIPWIMLWSVFGFLQYQRKMPDDKKRELGVTVIDSSVCLQRRTFCREGLRCPTVQPAGRDGLWLGCPPSHPNCTRRTAPDRNKQVRRYILPHTDCKGLWKNDRISENKNLYKGNISLYVSFKILFL